MTITAADFRGIFPEFNDTSKYPDAQVNLWLGMAVVMLNPTVWRTILDQATALYVAHHLAMGAKDQAASAAGGVPGMVTGPQASKSVDKVSVSYDTGAVTLSEAGFWNMTSYGIRLYTLAKTVGGGGLQL